MIIVTANNDLDLLKKKKHKLIKTLPVRFEWIATQLNLLWWLQVIDTQEIAVTLRVPVEGGGSTRGGIATLVRGFGGISSEKIFDIWLPLFAFLMHFGPEFQHSWADLEQAALAYPQWTIDIELTG